MVKNIFACKDKDKKLNKKVETSECDEKKLKGRFGAVTDEY